MPTSRTVPQQAENDVRVEMFNSFMNCPHRETDIVRKIHEEMRQKDPVFYAHLACYYWKTGDIRDHQELFSALLITDPYVENREVGLALFREHAVFMKAKILGFIKGKTVNIRQDSGEKIKRGKREVPKMIAVPKRIGLEKSIPTCLRTEVRDYLHWLESNPVTFDSVVMRNGKDQIGRAHV